MRPGRCLAAIPLPPHGRSDTRPSECIAQRASEPVASQRQDATVRHRRSMTPPSSQGRGGSVLAVRERSLDSFNPLLDAGSGKCDGYSRQSLPSSLSAGRARHERKGFKRSGFWTVSRPSSQPRLRRRLPRPASLSPQSPSLQASTAGCTIHPSSVQRQMNRTCCSPRHRVLRHRHLFSPRLDLPFRPTKTFAVRRGSTLTSGATPASPPRTPQPRDSERRRQHPRCSFAHCEVHLRELKNRGKSRRHASKDDDV